MGEFIGRFEAMMDQLRSIDLDLSEQVEVAIMHRAANLSKAEENNLLPMVDMTSTAPGLTIKMKEALRNIGFQKEKTAKKEEVVLLQYNNQEDCQENQEDVLFGRGYQNGNRGHYNDNRGFQQGFQSPEQQQRSYGNFQKPKVNFRRKVKLSSKVNIKTKDRKISRKILTSNLLVLE